MKEHRLALKARRLEADARMSRLVGRDAEAEVLEAHAHGLREAIRIEEERATLNEQLRVLHLEVRSLVNQCVRGADETVLQTRKAIVLELLERI